MKRHGGDRAGVRRGEHFRGDEINDGAGGNGGGGVGDKGNGYIESIGRGKQTKGRIGRTRVSKVFLKWL